MEDDEIAAEIGEGSFEIDDDVALPDVEPSPDETIDEQFAKQPFRVVYQTNNFLLPQIKALIDDGEDFTIRPEYQRRLRWHNKQKSLLIESLLLNVPVPPVFFYENDLARYEVMDGQQRLNAIKEFLDNSFKLRGLEVLSSLNGRSYLQLTPRVKRSLDRASISAIVVLHESQGSLKRAGTSRHYELRRFVFERLNTGGRRLTAQEIRNAIYGGAFNNKIVNLSRDPVFTRIWGIPAYQAADPNDYYEEPERQKNSLYRSMGDCQLVLRFFALDNDEHIQGSMRSMLDNCMERNLDVTPNVAEAMGQRYLDRLYFADQIFDQQPFILAPPGQPRHRPVAGVYDGVMVALDKIWDQRQVLLDRKPEVQAAYLALVTGESRGTLTGLANTSADIKARINLFVDLFRRFV
ncbi:MAG: DUF262 domain-containing protein [Brevundimonas sp.]